MPSGEMAGSTMQHAILLPGLLCDHRLWAAQTAELSGSARFSVPDLSPFDNVADMATAALDQAPERFALAGFSMGGYVALDIMSRAPGRVERLALLSTNMHKPEPTVVEHLGGSMAEIRAGGLDAYLDNAFPLYVAPDRVGDRSLRSTFKAMALDQGADAAIRQIKALLDFPDHTGTLGAIACPTAVICGAFDERAPVAVHRIFAVAIRGAVLTIVKGSGHFTPLEKPDAVTAALGAWLDR